MAKRIGVWLQRLKDREHLALQWYDPASGRRKTLTTGTTNPEEAERLRQAHEQVLNGGLLAEPSRLTWEAFRKLFDREFLAGRREGTRIHYRQVFDLFEELARPALLSDITERTVSGFLGGMRERPVRGRTGMAPCTMHIYLQIVRTALRWAVEQKLLKEAPKFPKVKVPKKRPQPVTQESFERLLAQAPDSQWRAVLLTGWLAGLRVGETYALEWEPTNAAPWVDFHRQRIVFPAEFVKTGVDQWVPIDPELRPVLEALPRRNKKVFELLGRSGVRLGLSSVCDVIATLGKKAGGRMTSHSLRKGFGCRYAPLVPAQVLQRLMRHASIKTTMDYYANIDDAVEEAVLGKREKASKCGSLREEPQKPPAALDGDEDWCW